MLARTNIHGTFFKHFASLLICLFLLGSAEVAQSQQLQEPVQVFYGNGQLKKIVLVHRDDTFAYRSYYRNGQLKDSLFMRIVSGNETPVILHKSYHKNGRVAQLIKYGRGEDEQTVSEYRSNGQIRFFEQRPTGVTRYYNRQGKVVREFDRHNSSYVRVPARYYSGQHLEKSGFAKRIKTKKATLAHMRQEKKIRAGMLIAIKTGSDSSLTRHCLIEGFSPDTIYLSRFAYSKTYDRIYDFDILEYKNTIAVPIAQIRTLYCAQNGSAGRRRLAKVCFGLGFSLMALPMVFLPGTVKALNENTLDYTSTAIGYGTTISAAGALLLLSRKFYKDGVQKKYNLENWQLIPEM